MRSLKTSPCENYHYTFTEACFQLSFDFKLVSQSAQTRPSPAGVSLTSNALPGSGSDLRCYEISHFLQKQNTNHFLQIGLFSLHWVAHSAKHSTEALVRSFYPDWDKLQKLVA